MNLHYVKLLPSTVPAESNIQWHSLHLKILVALCRNLKRFDLTNSMCLSLVLLVFCDSHTFALQYDISRQALADAPV